MGAAAGSLERWVVEEECQEALVPRDVASHGCTGRASDFLPSALIYPLTGVLLHSGLGSAWRHIGACVTLPSQSGLLRADVYKKREQTWLIVPPSLAPHPSSLPTSTMHIRFFALALITPLASAAAVSSPQPELLSRQTTVSPECIER